MQDISQEHRKKDHIDLARKAQTSRVLVDNRFFYEPLMSAHPTDDCDIGTSFLGKKLKAPFWVSSMTGGVGEARHINQNLARVAREFGLGMGLGSCRVLLDDQIDDQKKKMYFEDFNLRPIIGADLPLFANLGIAQVEALLFSGDWQKITDLLGALEADGIIVHINPLQEWFQPEGDRFKYSPIETLSLLCSKISTKIIVKEVGQGMGPRSLKALLDLPIAALELAAFGGTNFARLEQMRNPSQASWMQSLSLIGHTAPEMIQFLNDLLEKNPSYKQKEIIISGGIENALDGFNLMQKCHYSSVIGQAKNFLAHAENYDDLMHFVRSEIAGFKIAKTYLEIKTQECRE
ncbi:MAG: hypothetical protein KBD76_00705 [Bacteriovorax sp.]|nr:hypothetical protein [Bacteriovorax sp.]